MTSVSASPSRSLAHSVEQPNSLVPSRRNNEIAQFDSGCALRDLYEGSKRNIANAGRAVGNAGCRMHDALDHFQADQRASRAEELANHQKQRAFGNDNSKERKKIRTEYFDKIKEIERHMEAAKNKLKNDPDLNLYEKVERSRMLDEQANSKKKAAQDNLNEQREYLQRDYDDDCKLLGSDRTLITELSRSSTKNAKDAITMIGEVAGVLIDRESDVMRMGIDLGKDLAAINGNLVNQALEVRKQNLSEKKQSEEHELAVQRHIDKNALDNRNANAAIEKDLRENVRMMLELGIEETKVNNQKVAQEQNHTTEMARNETDKARIEMERNKKNKSLLAFAGDLFGI